MKDETTKDIKAPKFANSVTWHVNDSGTQLTFSFINPDDPKSKAQVANFVIPNDLAMNMSMEVAKLVNGLSALHKGSTKKN